MVTTLTVGVVISAEAAVMDDARPSSPWEGGMPAKPAGEFRV